jgi:predicted dinucleotide-binding enzyme
MSATLPVVAILGGTGALGRGLAIRWAAAGYPLLIGLREAAKTEAMAGTIFAGAGADAVRGMNNLSAARETVIGMAKAIGLRGVDAGPLANSVAADALTSILIGINRRYKVDGAGIRITGDFGASGS